ncbi:uncharacterized protein LOC111049387 [Nilaparvata lugens]|uniref:uncharacterized protein LOC111049387 n=1 Tax=Nilaparvata lugens TaxID=108931 RepID=UPI00193CCC39|nr:uncharacterized protein LOC111049387 [Nilaparvata lugens]
MAITPGDEDSSSGVGVAVPGLFRSRSLPHLYTTDSGVGGSFSDAPGAVNGSGSNHHHHHRDPPGTTELRQLLTLKQHYYPEGGWGWVVLLTAFLVQLLTHGLHTASGVLLSETVNRFGREVAMPAVSKQISKYENIQQQQT